MQIIQFENRANQRAVAKVEGNMAYPVKDIQSVRDLALLAIRNKVSLEQQVEALGFESETYDYSSLLADLKVLPPLDHPDPTHCLISGTGLTHLGSASARDKMHQQNLSDDSSVTDTMRIFQWGLQKGRPAEGQIGAQPEWFYKGDGSIVVRPGAELPLPPFAEDGGEEPEIAGLYVIGEDLKPYRIGFALGNEYSDHVMERRNYLYLAHSKLRFCSFGPALRTGELPKHLVGTSRLRRNGQTIWEKEFLSGEDNMCHSLANLEYHHFKYQQFLKAGDVHIHYFGTATLSFADGIQVQVNDEFEIEMKEFGYPLRNKLAHMQPELPIGSVITL
ncbi:AraD1 family protein [Acinetobacter nosocomialis]|uniref:AraD1 family protein n=1 Tax=Acinetobacter nosocomialis TaxID=106654 RepID=UPI001F240031|nr:AraD1 family protein [Acinetobacter nosocomialis]MCE5998993.1 FAH family protein [Acinetobacter nosocomialis]MCH2010457.1 FAH family protein [Acinetobacter nosocomialis]HBM1867543.1 FAH family protein [Acinetobacter nosocomialis]HCT3321340.1 FAH family protein [Acinetobacter nosocomialis]